MQEKIGRLDQQHTDLAAKLQSLRQLQEELQAKLEQVTAAAETNV